MGSQVEIFEILEIPEIFVHITNYLSDKTKIILLYCSKTFNNNRKLLKFKSKYDFHKVYDQWCFPYIKNIFINKFTSCPNFESAIIKFIEKSSIDPTLIKSTHIKLTLNDNNVNLHYSSYLLYLLIKCKHLDIMKKIIPIASHETIKKIIITIPNKNEALFKIFNFGLFMLSQFIIAYEASVSDLTINIV